MNAPALKIVLAYCVAASLWVVGSDQLIAAAGLAGVTISQTMKGLLFVGCTAILLCWVLWREFSLREATEEMLRNTLGQLRQSESDLRAIVDNLPDAFYRTDLSGRIVMASPRFAQEFGFDQREVLGLQIADYYVEPDGRSAFLMALDQNGGQLRQYEVAMRRRDGTVFWLSVNAVFRRDAGGRPLGIEGIARNITEQRATSERLRHLAGHDALTGLCNRLLFEDRLNHAIARARRDNRSFALLFLDLDGFKEINDGYGHHTGDTTLTLVAERLAASLRDSDTIARMGGDEFAALLEGAGTADDARTVARKLIEAVHAPLPDLPCRVSTSVGIALFPRDGSDSDALLRSADQAMYRAKRLGKNRCEVNPY